MDARVLNEQRGFCGTMGEECPNVERCEGKKAKQSHNGSLFGLFASSMLSSSCCIVQLLFNALSLSCAGFKVFTPYKRWFWATSALFGVLWVAKSKYAVSWKALIVLSAVVVALSEEGLEIYNNRGSDAFHNEPTATVDKAGSDAGVIMVKVPQMGCQACATKIKHAVLDIVPDQSATCVVNLAEKTVKIGTKGSHEVDLADVVSAISKAGYFAHPVSKHDQHASTSPKTEL